MLRGHREEYHPVSISLLPPTPLYGPGGLKRRYEKRLYGSWSAVATSEKRPTVALANGLVTASATHSGSWFIQIH